MSSYIADLRKIVGHRTLIQCAGSIIIENEKGEILLGRRTDNHMWGYAGGSIEIDERIEECAKRELFEETGLIADEMTLFMINSGPEVHYVYPNGDEVSNVEIIYLCKKYHGTLKRQEEEIEELRFLPLKMCRMSFPRPSVRWWKNICGCGRKKKCPTDNFRQQENLVLDILPFYDIVLNANELHLQIKTGRLFYHVGRYT